MNKKNLITRTITGVIFISCVIGSILGGAKSFFALFAAFSAFSVWEYCRLINIRKGGIRVDTLLAMLGSLVLSAGLWQMSFGRFGKILICLYIALIMLVFAKELYFYSIKSAGRIVPFLTSQVAVALPFALLFLISNQEGKFAKEILLFFFIVIWANDTCAYLSGSLFGKHKMASAISPNKTWEGFIGGILLAEILICTTIAVFLQEIPFFARWHWTIWGVLVAVIAVAGTLGDFLESLLKRLVGQKDSGKMLPGHGGLLDRFDSVLMAAPALYIVLTIIDFFANF